MQRFLLLCVSFCFIVSVTPVDAGTLEIYRLLNLFGDVFSRVRTDYVEPVEDQKLIETALDGMLTALDPHSSYMNEKEFQELKDMTRGEFGGIGVEIVGEHGVIKVITPIDDTPAFQAGIEPGDYIVEVNDESILGISSMEAVEKMRGKPGTSLKLKIVREGKDPFNVEMKREQISVKPVRWTIEKDIAIIRITTFIDENTGDKLLLALKEIREKLGHDPKGIILDLRNNAGGLFEQAVAVADVFLDSKEIVSIRGRDEKEPQRAYSAPGDQVKGIPIIVLINNWTASCPEIVAGALQDHKRATILGTRSYGKGSVQTVMSLSGYGGLRLTTHLYYTPKGRSIQGKGIEPDIEVSQAKVQIIDDTKDAFREENIPGALRVELNRVQQEKVKKEEEKKVLSSKKEEGKQADKKEKSIKNPSEDYQLRRAIDLIEGLSVVQSLEKVI